jgi:uncharacterized lipoprotein NlpE involved in copper resistance
MIKVIIIFAIIVCVIMVLGCDNKSKSIVTGGKIITGGDNEIDIPDYSKKHARSIQDDIKKVVSKNI